MVLDHPLLPFKISIHAPPEGSDPSALNKRVGVIISIHAPPEGSDRAQMCKVSTGKYFNTTTPGRARPGPRGRLIGWVVD